jgi:hypothetical protein
MRPVIVINYYFTTSIPGHNTLFLVYIEMLLWVSWPQGDV